jgi:hypothetical protein
VKITGIATDSERLLDVYIFVGTRKLYDKSNRDGADPRKATVDFDARLRPGVNLITVVARETPIWWLRGNGTLLYCATARPDWSPGRDPRRDADL